MMIVFKNELNALITMLSWIAPTQNTDGSDISYALTYQLYVDGVAVMVFPGTLNESGRYEFQLADVPAISEPGDYILTLTAFPEGVDLAEKPEVESDQSNELLIMAVSVLRPNVPGDLSTE